MIDNPAYKGVWEPRSIPNPEYHSDPAPLSNIGKVCGSVAAGTGWPMFTACCLQDLQHSTAERLAPDLTSA